MAVASLLGACSSPTFDKEQITLPTATVTTPAEKDPDSTASSDRQRIPRGFKKYYRQEITWSSCDGDFECALITAPMDWKDPDSDSISLALTRLSASGDAQGSLLVNPGGPGQSGTEFLTYAANLLSEDVRENYDIVGFDPRGVGRSESVKCYDAAEWDAFVSASYPPTDDGHAAASAAIAEFGRACAARTGSLLGHIDTLSAARDMDMMRVVLGDTRLNYLGYSYGTLLGSTYAGLFPGNVGRMVLDGGIDPSLAPFDIVVGQAAGFERALTNYVTYCLERSDCPLSGSVADGLDQISVFVEGLLANPMRTDDPERTLTQSLGVTGIVYPLYSQTMWPVLTSALEAALVQGDGTTLLANADAYNARDTDGDFADNSGQAFLAINCLEPRLDDSAETFAKLTAELADVAPTLGTSWAIGDQCAGWPYPDVPRDYDLSAPGSSAILVIGTTGDPATPYEWSQGLAQVLAAGVLLTYDGEGHGAYGLSNACVTENVDGYLISGIVPEDGVTC